MTSNRFGKNRFLQISSKNESESKDSSLEAAAMAGSEPLDVVETLRQEIKALEAEIALLNNRIDILIKAQEDHPERWDRLQDEILEKERIILENKRQITEKQTTGAHHPAAIYSQERTPRTPF